VSGAVDEERGMEREHLPELGGHQVRDQQVLAPQPPRDDGGQDVGQDGGQRRVQPVLPHDHPVRFHVGHVHRRHLGLERRVRHHERPSDVRVEEPAVRVVRVSVRVRVLVVQPVVAHPVVDAVLDADRLEQGEDDAQRQLGLVRVMRPQPVRAGRHADRRHGADRERCNDTIILLLLLLLLFLFLLLLLLLLTNRVKAVTRGEKSFRVFSV